MREIFLIDRPLTTPNARSWPRCRAERRRRARARVDRARTQSEARGAIAEAQLIIYAPGTQHSSLFPSYLTPGLGEAIAANLDAIKLLVTNIQKDAEITGRSAVDLIDRAVFYLRDKDRLTIPTPCLITHYLLNDPAARPAEQPYVPLGRLESLEDPRLVRVGNYEAGASGRHDAAKVLAPYIDGFIARERSVQRVAVVLGETRSPNKVVQTILEMVRGGIADLPIDLTVFHAGEPDLDRAFLERLPFPVTRLARATDARPGSRAARRARGRALRLRGAVRLVRHVQRRRHRRPGRASDAWPARRGLGQPPAVGARHPGVVSAAVPRTTRCRARSARSAATC